MSTREILHAVHSDLTSAENLLAGFYAPWDADDTRPLHLLKDVLDAQQRALVALLKVVEEQARITATARAHVDWLEVTA